MSEDILDMTVRELLAAGWHPVVYGGREVREQVDSDAAIGRVVWDYIDRMNDVCEQDTADRILGDFTKAVTPFILAAIADRYTLTEAGYRAVMQQGAKLNGEVKAGEDRDD